MLRKRLIAVLTLNDGVLFRTKLFRPDYRYTSNFVDAWSIDEIVVLDITRKGEGSRTNFEQAVRDFAKRCFVPLAAGGGVRTLADVDRLLAIGADKIVVNSGALARSELITEIARSYGSQCAVVSIDAKPDGNGRYRVFSDFATRDTGLDAASLGAPGAGLRSRRNTRDVDRAGRLAARVRSRPCPTGCQLGFHSGACAWRLWELAACSGPVELDRCRCRLHPEHLPFH